MENSQAPKYSIVIPAFKEESIIESTLKNIYKLLVESQILEETEVVVVAADGRDDTAVLAKEFASEFNYFQLIEPGPKVGKGRDVRVGMLAARGDYILFTDADLATPAHHIPNAFALLEAGAMVVIGTRKLKTIHDGYRTWVSRSSNVLTRLLILPGVSDTQCGFKAFTKESVKAIFKKSSIDGWSFDVEVIALAKKYEYLIVEMPIDDWYDPKLNTGFLGEHPMKAILKSLKELFVIRYRFWIKKYD